ncbi:MAG: heme NO-binding domain-containing protein [Gemmatimonadota bacterium]
MQGLIYHYLRDFCAQQFGEPVWERARCRAQVPERSFLLMRQYPDRYTQDLVSALREELGPEGPPAGEILFGFGRHLGACFQRDFEWYFDRFASAKEMLAGIEPVIHAELRRHSPETRPPELQARPLPRGGLRLRYRSPRRLCDVMRGLIVHVAQVYGDRVVIRERTCMNRGDDACELLLAFSGNGSGRSGASPP